MKNTQKIILNTLLLIAALFYGFSANATHIMGGDIAYTYVSANTYTIQLTLYRDCAGIQVSNCYEVEFYSPSHSNWSTTLDLYPSVGCQEVTPVTPGCGYNSTCNGGSQPGVDQCIFTGTISGLPAYSDIYVIFETAARNWASITNLINTNTNKGISLIAMIDNASGINASSPVFSSIPTPYLCPGTHEIFSQGAYDPNGDSLTFTQIAPYNGAQPNGGGGGGGGNNCGLATPFTIPFNFADSLPYATGFNSHYPLTVKSGTSFCFDASTGQLSFTPSGAQVTVMAVRVSKLRKIAGIWTIIGSVERDIQIYVLSGANCTSDNPPVLKTPINVSGGTLVTTLSKCDGTDTYSFTVCAGNTLNFTLPASDSDATQTLTAVTNGATALPGATVSITNGATANKKNITVSWKPSVLLVGSYLFTVTLTDNACPLTGKTINTIRVYVQPVLSVVSQHDTICLGKSATLTAQGASSYSWTSSSSATVTTGASITVSPTVNTTYYVTSPLTSCKYKDTVYVVVAPKVVASALFSGICIGSSLTLTGKNGKTYAWSPNISATTSTVTVSPTVTTTYTLIGKNIAGCYDTSTLVVKVNALPTISVTAKPDTICLGGSTTLTASGASTYTWSPGALTGTTLSVSPTANTNYVVTGKANATGCINKDSIIVIVNSLPVLTAGTSRRPICSGTLDTLTATGAQTYTWLPGGKTGSPVTVNPTTATTYTVTGTNKWGCISTDTVVVTTKALPVLTITSLPASAAICVNGSITLTASGANNYVWMPGNINTAAITVSPTATQVYTVTGTKTSTGCINTDSLSVTVYPLPTITATATANPICKGKSTTITAAGASTYKWMPGSKTTTSITVSPTVSSRYSITGTDVHGCVDTGSIFITVDTIPVVSATAAPDSICNGKSTTLTGKGASTYLWKSGNKTGTSITVNPTTTTTYTVTGTDGNGCIGTNNVTVVVMPLPVINFANSTSTICYGQLDTLAPSGSSSSYTWTPGNYTGDSIIVSPTTTTTYNITGKTKFGCTNTASVIVKVNPLPVLTLTTTADSLCAGALATLTAGGANTYTWTPGAFTTNTISVTPATTTKYIVTGKLTATGCTNKDSINIKVNPLPTITAIATPSTICAGATSTLQATGGVSYSWSPGNYTGGSVVVNPADTTRYTVTGTDIKGCKDTASVVLTVNPLPVIYFTKGDTICHGDTAVLTPLGTTSTYKWKPGNLTGNTIKVHPTTSTTYTITGTSAVGCKDTATVYVKVNPLPVITITVPADSLCAGASTTLTANGASTYKWMPGASTNNPLTITPAATTVYTVIGTSTVGCVNKDSIHIKVNPLPTVTLKATSSTICLNKTDTLTATGGGTYNWMPGSYTTATVHVSPTVTTRYVLTVTNTISGCKDTTGIKVQVDTLPKVIATSASTSICTGTTTTVTATGASKYVWSPGAATTNTISVNPTTTTVYTVTGTSAVGCVNTDTAIVKVKPLPAIFVTPKSDSVCNGKVATLTAGGASTYSWTSSSSVVATTGAAITVSPANNTRYYVTGISAINCSDTSSVYLKVFQLPNVAGTVAPTTICYGDSSILTATGGVRYVWSPGNDTTAVIKVKPTVTTTYIVTGKDAHQCSKPSQNIVVNVNQLPTLTLTPTNAVLCKGQTATLTINGADTYTWMPGSLGGANISVTPTASTTYTVTGTNSTTKCIDTATVKVTVNPLPTITIKASSAAICVQKSDTLTASGASTYVWKSPVSTENPYVVNPLGTTTYTVTGTDGNGCVNNNNYTVIVDSLPLLNLVASPRTICIYDSAKLTVHTNKKTTYLWAPGNYTDSILWVKPATTAVYTLTTSSNKGVCVNTDTISVSVNPLPVVTVASTSPVICRRVADTLTAQGANTYLWTPGNLTGATVYVTPNTTQTYTVKGTSAEGCVNTAHTNVTVKPLPVISVAANIMAICAHDSALLTGAGGIRYKWIPGAARDTTDTLNAKPLTSTRYIVWGTGANGCSDSAGVYILVHPLPLVKDTAAPAYICIGQSTTVTASGAHLYTWVPATNNHSPILHVTPDSTTRYIVTGYDQYGCHDTASFLLGVNQTPAVNSHYDTTIYATYSTPIHTSNPNSVYYLWSPNTYLSDSNTATPISTPPQTIVYTAQLNNMNGCPIVDTFIVYVKPDCVGVFVPNAFSPNADGINDKLQLIILHDDFLDNFVVYDRWGNKVFQTNNPADSWDGNYNGQPMPIGSYAYFVQYRCKNGGTIQKEGNISLLR